MSEKKSTVWSNMIPFVSDNKKELIALGIDVRKLLLYDPSNKKFDGESMSPEFRRNMRKTYCLIYERGFKRLKSGKLFTEGQLNYLDEFLLDNFGEIQQGYREAKEFQEEEAKPKNNVKTKNCTICGNQFVGKWNQKYCSKTCQNKAKKQNGKK